MTHRSAAHIQCKYLNLKETRRIDNPIHKESGNMNQILSGDKIKALAVTILDDQRPEEFLACQSGSTLITIRLKNAPFQTIPFRTLFFIQGKLVQGECFAESLTIEVDLTQDENRFVSLNPNTIRLYQGLTSVFDILDSLPDLSDKKPFPNRMEFEHLYLFMLEKHAHHLKVVRDELYCGNFDGKTPKYIKGLAYEKLFEDWKLKMLNQKAKLKSTPSHKLIIKKRPSKPKGNENIKMTNRKVSREKENKKVLVSIFDLS